MVVVLTIIHILVCFFLMVVVLLQSGKAADLAGAFGGMGSQTAFGARGSATVLSKATTIAAAVFMLTSLTLAIMATRSSGGTGSVLEKQKAPAKTTAPNPAGNTSVPVPGTPAAPAQPGQAAPAQAPAPAQGGKQPSMTIIKPDGSQTTIPVQIPNGSPGQPPAGQQPAPKK
ncbi:MAG TPA: preprotein translocase subunit SecG [Bryobacteraceae bacterium]|nr:preprotein translocase subunit SecG [Bryobacteraceae bacterium]